MAGLVSDTVQAWNPAETSEKLELQVGRDLQFIRINGTVIGALAGVVIFSVGELIMAISGRPARIRFQGCLATPLPCKPSKD